MQSKIELEYSAPENSFQIEFSDLARPFMLNISKSIADATTSGFQQFFSHFYSNFSSFGMSQETYASQNQNSSKRSPLEIIEKKPSKKIFTSQPSQVTIDTIVTDKLIMELEEDDS